MGDVVLDLVLVRTGGGVEALGGGVEAPGPVDHGAGREAGFEGDLLEGLLQRRGDDAGTGGLVGGLELLDESQHLLLGPQQGGAAAGDHALLDSRLGGAPGVLAAVLLLLELDLRGAADLAAGATTGQLAGAPLALPAAAVPL